MKFSELVKEFKIFTSNEEDTVMCKLDSPTPIHQFSEREQTLIENLVRKSLVSKIKHHNQIFVVKNV